MKAVEYSCACQSGYNFDEALCVNIIESCYTIYVVSARALKTASTSMDSQASEFIQGSLVSISLDVILLHLRIQTMAMDLASI